MKNQITGANKKRAKVKWNISIWFLNMQNLEFEWKILSFTSFPTEKQGSGTNFKWKITVIPTV